MNESREQFNSVNACHIIPDDYPMRVKQRHLADYALGERPQRDTLKEYKALVSSAKYTTDILETIAKIRQRAIQDSNSELLEAMSEVDCAVAKTSNQYGSQFNLQDIIEADLSDHRNKCAKNYLLILDELSRIDESDSYYLEPMTKEKSIDLPECKMIETYTKTNFEPSLEESNEKTWEEMRWQLLEEFQELVSLDIYTVEIIERLAEIRENAIENSDDKFLRRLVQIEDANENKGSLSVEEDIKIIQSFDPLDWQDDRITFPLLPFGEEEQERLADPSLGLYPSIYSRIAWPEAYSLLSFSLFRSVKHLIMKSKIFNNSIWLVLILQGSRFFQTKPRSNLVYLTDIGLEKIGNTSVMIEASEKVLSSGHGSRWPSMFKLKIPYFKKREDNQEKVRMYSKQFEPHESRLYPSSFRMSKKNANHIMYKAFRKKSERRFKLAVKSLFAGIVVSMIGFFIIQKGLNKVGSVLITTGVTSTLVSGGFAMKFRRKIKEFNQGEIGLLSKQREPYYKRSNH
jgi:hypothetical protein